MTFVRTNAGLSNEALFRNVDLIAYVEGRQTTAGIEQGSPPDELFWKAVLTTYAPNTKFFVKGVGSKVDVKVIADKIAAGAVTGCLACMDADYDRWTAREIVHPKVLYTYGYSWENDIIDDHGICEVIELLSTRFDRLRNEARPMECLAHFRRVSRRILPIDIITQDQGSPIQDKKKPGSLLILGGGMPRFNKARIIKQISNSKPALSRPIFSYAITTISMSFDRDYFGKSVLLIHYHLALYTSRQYGAVGSIPFKVFENLLIGSFVRRLSSRTDVITTHYSNMIRQAAV